MKSGANRGADVQVEIQKTLVHINDVTLKIRKELEAINEMVKENGELQTAVVDANKTLSGVAQELGIDVKEILAGSGNGEELNLPQASTVLIEKILASINT